MAAMAAVAAAAAAARGGGAAGSGTPPATAALLSSAPPSRRGSDAAPAPTATSPTAAPPDARARLQSVLARALEDADFKAATPAFGSAPVADSHCLHYADNAALFAGCKEDYDKTVRLTARHPHAIVCRVATPLAAPPRTAAVTRAATAARGVPRAAAPPTDEVTWHASFASAVELDAALAEHRHANAVDRPHRCIRCSAHRFRGCGVHFERAPLLRFVVSAYPSRSLRASPATAATNAAPTADFIVGDAGFVLSAGAAGGNTRVTPPPTPSYATAARGSAKSEQPPQTQIDDLIARAFARLGVPLAPPLPSAAVITYGTIGEAEAHARYFGLLLAAACPRVRLHAVRCHAIRADLRVIDVLPHSSRDLTAITDAFGADAAAQLGSIDNDGVAGDAVASSVTGARESKGEGKGEAMLRSTATATAEHHASATSLRNDGAAGARRAIAALHTAGAWSTADAPAHVSLEASNGTATAAVTCTACLASHALYGARCGDPSAREAPLLQLCFPSLTSARLLARLQAVAAAHGATRCVTGNSAGVQWAPSHVVYIEWPSRFNDEAKRRATLAVTNAAKDEHALKPKLLLATDAAKCCAYCGAASHSTDRCRLPAAEGALGAEATDPALAAQLIAIAHEPLPLSPASPSANGASNSAANSATAALLSGAAGGGGNGRRGRQADVALDADGRPTERKTALAYGWCLREIDNGVCKVRCGWAHVRESARLGHTRSAIERCGAVVKRGPKACTRGDACAFDHRTRQQREADDEKERAEKQAAEMRGKATEQKPAARAVQTANASGGERSQGEEAEKSAQRSAAQQSLDHAAALAAGLHTAAADGALAERQIRNAAFDSLPETTEARARLIEEKAKADTAGETKRAAATAAVATAATHVAPAGNSPRAAAALSLGCSPSTGPPSPKKPRRATASSSAAAAAADAAPARGMTPAAAPPAPRSPLRAATTPFRRTSRDDLDDAAAMLGNAPPSTSAHGATSGDSSDNNASNSAAAHAAESNSTATGGPAGAIKPRRKRRHDQRSPPQAAAATTARPTTAAAVAAGPPNPAAGNRATSVEDSDDGRNAIGVKVGGDGPVDTPITTTVTATVSAASIARAAPTATATADDDHPARGGGGCVSV